MVTNREMTLVDNNQGNHIRREGYIDAMRELFPDWAGEYPKEDGWYYFDIDYDCITTIVYVFADNREFVSAGFGEHISFDDTEPEQWGPKVPMWREV